jgi:hypothetical protein
MRAMSTHDRMMAVYRKELPDRIPLSIYSRYLPRGSHERELRERELGIIDYHAAVSLLAPPWHVYPDYLSEVTGVDLRITYSWENGQRMETRSLETPVGTIWQQSRKDPTYGSDWITRYYVSNAEDYKILQYVVEHTVFRRNEEQLAARIRDLGQDGVVLGRVDRSPYQKLLIELAGPEQFLIDLADTPAPVSEVIETMDARMNEAFAMILESQAEVIWQPDNITADLTPPAMFERYCLPFYQRHGEQCRQAGKPYLVHMDGRLGPLKDLVARCPLDAVESFSLPEVGGDLSLSQARLAWPDKVVLPNFPSPLCHQSEQEIESWMLRLLAEAGHERPFMLQISEDIPAGQWQRVLPILCGLTDLRERSG